MPTTPDTVVPTGVVWTTVVWVQPGEIIDISRTKGWEDLTMVLGNCGSDRSHGFFCVTCKATLANRGQLEMHLDAGGAHRIVAYCDARRIYESAMPIVIPEAGEK